MAIIVTEGTSVSSNNVTVVTLFAKVEVGKTKKGLPKYQVFEAKGSAVKHPLDRNNAQIGVLLATARAQQSLTRKIARQAAGMVKCADDNTKQHAKIKAKSKKQKSLKKKDSRKALPAKAS